MQPPLVKAAKSPEVKEGYGERVTLSVPCSTLFPKHPLPFEDRTYSRGASSSSLYLVGGKNKTASIYTIEESF